MLPGLHPARRRYGVRYLIEEDAVPTPTVKGAQPRTPARATASGPAPRRESRCIAVDWRGRGDSPPTVPGYALERLVGGAGLVDARLAPPSAA